MSTYVVTGANRGIGLELTKALLSRSETVVGVCRRSSDELASSGARVIAGVDLTTDDGVEALAKALAGTRIDVLVNNAGLLVPDGLDTFERDALTQQMEVNAFGPLRLTRALLPLVESHGKVVLVTSRMGSMGDNHSGGYYGYRMSKAAANAAFVSLARDVGPRGVAVGLFHPGMVATEMTGGNGIPPAEAAAGLLRRIDELDVHNAGRFLHQNGDALPW